MALQWEDIVVLTSLFSCALLSPRKVRTGMDVIGTDAQQLLPDIIKNRLFCNTFFNELPGVFLIQDYFVL